MFGGVGIYAGDLFFALLAEDRLYLKVDDSNRDDFAAEGMGPFAPFGHDGLVLQYYEVPLEVIESPVRLAKWAAKAILVAERARKSKATRKRTAKPTTTPKATNLKKSNSKKPWRTYGRA